MNICMCGAQDGYPHAEDCPYPMYKGGALKESQWLDARRELRKKRKAEPKTDSVMDAGARMGTDAQ